MRGDQFERAETRIPRAESVRGRYSPVRSAMPPRAIRAGQRAQASRWGDVQNLAQEAPSLGVLGRARIILRLSTTVADQTVATTVAIDTSGAVATRTELDAHGEPRTRSGQADLNGVFDLVEACLPGELVPTQLDADACTLTGEEHLLTSRLCTIMLDPELDSETRRVRAQAEGADPVILDALDAPVVSMVALIQLRSDTAECADGDEWTAMWTVGREGVYAIELEQLEPPPGHEEAGMRISVRPVPVSWPSKLLRSQIAHGVEQLHDLDIALGRPTSI